MAESISQGGRIWVPHNFAEQRKAPRPDMNAIATTLDGRDITRGYVSPLMLLPPQDTVLLQRGGGNLRVYEQLLRDTQVASTFERRRLAVTSKEWYVEPGGKRAKDKAAAESLEHMLRNVRWDAVTNKMLYGRFYGYSVSEMLYARDGREIVLDSIRVRKARRFRFDGELRLRMLTTAVGEGELMPDRKFWVYYTGADNDDEPYGLGLGHYLYWPVLFKRQDERFWLIFLEKFGMPTSLGTYPAGSTPEEKSRLLGALAAITTDSGVIVPDGMAVELLEAARSGTADYDKFMERMDHAISKVVVGHTAAADATPGRLGGESTAEEVRGDLTKADADEVCESFNNTVARWMTDWNYPGAAYPKVWRRTEEPIDQVNRSEALANLSKLGYRPTLKQIQDEFGGEFEDISTTGTAPDAGNDPTATLGSSAFSEASFQDRVRAKGLERAIEEWAGQIRTIVDKSKDLPDLSRRLTAAFGELSSEQFAAVMAQAVTLASLKGRADAEQDAG